MGFDTQNYRFDGTKRVDIRHLKTDDTGVFHERGEVRDGFRANLRRINELQLALYAERKEGIVFIFQAMDAAGKDGVIRTVFSTLSPHGVKEYCFKTPSQEELNHDFLWRFWSALPAKGNISIFNRSYYESVLVERVHALWKDQPMPDRVKKSDVIRLRYEQIADYEKYLYTTGTRVIKIFLNVSEEEQARRFLSRIDTPSKNWKLSERDIAERDHWDEYMESFERMIDRTATPEAPWFVVPADHKWFARFLVSQIVLDTLKSVDPHYPTVSPHEKERVAAMKNKLLCDLKRAE